MKKNGTKLSMARLAREFDQPRGPRSLVPPASEKQRHDAIVQKIKRQRGRPRVGAGAQRLQITMERSLLSKTDRFARAGGMTRSELIASCLMPVVSKRSA